MTKGLKTERDVVRLFKANGMDVRSIRRRKHWVVTASRKGSDLIGKFILSVSPSDIRAVKQIAAEFKRGPGRQQPIPDFRGTAIDRAKKAGNPCTGAGLSTRSQIIRSLSNELP